MATQEPCAAVIEETAPKQLLEDRGAVLPQYGLIVKKHGGESPLENYHTGVLTIF